MLEANQQSLILSTSSLPSPKRCSKKVWPLLNLSSVQILTLVFYMTCSLVMLFVSDSLRGEYLDVFKQ